MEMDFLVGKLKGPFFVRAVKSKGVGTGKAILHKIVLLRI